MFKTILVPIDIAETEPGIVALELAKDLAKTHGAKLAVMSVIEQVPGYIATQVADDVREKVLEEADRRLQAIAKEHGLAGKTEVLVRRGHPSTEILEHAKKTKADMIVVGAHNPGVADYFLGSVAARVVRQADCSVLVARKTDG